MKKTKMLNVIVVTTVIAGLAGLAGFGLAQATSDAAEQPIEPPELVTATSNDTPRLAADTPTDALPADASQVVEHGPFSADAGTTLPSVEITPTGSLPLDAAQVGEHIDGWVEDPPANLSLAGSIDATARQLEVDATGDEMLGMVDSSIPPSERFPG